MNERMNEWMKEYAYTWRLYAVNCKLQDNSHRTSNNVIIITLRLEVDKSKYAVNTLLKLNTVLNTGLRAAG